MSGLFERLKADTAADWQAYTHHPFVNGLGDGTLAEGAFRHYLVQDYLFLIQFARAYALAVYKSDNLADMQSAAETMNGILNTEMQLHVGYCAGYGISAAEMEQAPEAPECTAYTRVVLGGGREREREREGERQREIHTLTICMSSRLC